MIRRKLLVIKRTKPLLFRYKDFCYVVHSTVEYYLYRRKPLIDSYEPLHAVDGGYYLEVCCKIICIICMTSFFLTSLYIMKDVHTLKLHVTDPHT